MSNVPKQFVGYVRAKKISGSASYVANNTLFNIPTYNVGRPEPRNFNYAAMINNTGWTVNYVRGRNTPSIGFDTAIHTGWIGTSATTPTAANVLNSWIASYDSNNDSDKYSFLSNDGGGNSLTQDGCRCTSLVLSGTGAGGGFGVQTSWLATTNSGVASFSGSYATVPGTFADVASMDFNATATEVDSWALTLVRGQGYNMFFNPGSYDPYDVDSGMLGGTLELVMNPNAATVPSSTFTVRIYTDSGLGTRILTATAKINLDTVVYNMSAGLGRTRRLYTLIDSSSGTIPIAFS